MEMYWYANCVTRLVEGREVPGVYFPAFIHNGDYYLTSIVAYQDGMVECWGWCRSRSSCKRSAMAGS